MKKPLHIYIHSPFCHHHCPYCDFFVIAKAKQPIVDSYISALMEEMRSAGEIGFQNREIKSIFLGGGTPSLLASHHLDQMLHALSQEFSFSTNCEITLETNPEDVVDQKAKDWKSLGINRISLGVQSLQNSELKFLERNHSAEQAIQSCLILEKNGFKNCSFDLMFSLPYQTLETLGQTLHKIQDLPLSHVSAYNLTIEERTRFHTLYQSNKQIFPDEETQRHMLEMVRGKLNEMNFKAYEISNFAKSHEFESIHNKAYWNGSDYWGLGASAHSFQKNGHSFKRWSNEKNISTYVKKQWERNIEHLTPEQHFLERLFTGLRQSRGIDLDQIERELSFTCPTNILAEFELWIHSNWMSSHHQKQFALTETGIFVSDALFLRLSEKL